MFRAEKLQKTVFLPFLFTLFLWLGLGPAVLAEDVVDVTAQQEGDRYAIYGENRDPWAPYHVVVTLPKLENLKTSASLPFPAVLSPTSKAVLFYLDPVDPQQSTNFSTSFTYGVGDPNIVPDGYKYLLPYAHGTKHNVCQGYFGRQTHQNCYCLDFEMDEGTNICAARDGMVIRVKDDSDRGGPSPSFEQDANVIEVLQTDGTLAEYAHLKYKGVLVKVGDHVAAGQIIGLSGNTGYSSGPHLHFVVEKPDWGDPKSMATQFLSKDNQGISLEEGRAYYSYHPDGQPFEEVLAEKIKEVELEKIRKQVPLDNELKIREETVDYRVYIYCSNGTASARRLTLSFPEMQNCVSSKPVPCTLEVPNGKEIYFLYMTRQDFEDPFSYSSQVEATDKELDTPAMDAQYALTKGDAAYLSEKYSVARDWYSLALDKGSAEAMYHMGLMYEKGQGVQADVDQAKQWYQKAVDAGFVGAQMELDRLK